MAKDETGMNIPFNAASKSPEEMNSLSPFFHRRELERQTSDMFLVPGNPSILNLPGKWGSHASRIVFGW